ncbi:M24 family metallopeptidase [Microvirga calopogonii]|uniref:M24 family metallopeptidase n=1 Tax=Microvirga calopogonii TaxID=2078013 RepID=UPI000E0CC81B|nr:Xaa-Pro peptidase family protein [Microvirga calopogonii]
MSKNDFTLEEFASRQRRVREEIARSALDWMLLFHPVSIHWLTGSDAKSYQAFQCLLVSATDERLRIFTRESERSEFEADALVDEVRTWGGPELQDPVDGFVGYAASLGLMKARVGMEVPAYYLHPHHYLRLKSALGSALVSEPNNLVHGLKLVKSDAELAYVRQASRIADQSVVAMTRALTPGRSELEIAAHIHHAILSAGGSIPASPLNLVSGPRSGFSHGAPTDRRLQRGDFGHAEYNVPYRRYTTSIGRHFSIGTPTSRMQELHDLARTAADACIAEIRHGVPASKPHAAAAKIIAAAGLERARVHLTGYGLAPAFPPATAEPIQLVAESTAVLKAGMVLSICPPIFIGPERLGVRLVDNVIVTQTGAEILSKQPRDLIVVD